LIRVGLKAGFTVVMSPGAARGLGELALFFAFTFYRRARPARMTLIVGSRILRRAVLVAGDRRRDDNTAGAYRSPPWL